MKNGNSILDTLDALPMAIADKNVYPWLALLAMFIILAVEYRLHKREIRERQSKGRRYH